MDIRSKILDAKDISEEVIHVAEWGCDILVRGLTGKARAKLLQAAGVGSGKTDIAAIYPQIVIGTSYDPETRRPVFEPTDAEALNEKSGGVLERIAQVGMRLSGMTGEAVAQAEKNSSKASADSTSPSPENSAVQ